MTHEVTIAQTPEEISALRSRVFLRGAEEILKIGTVKKETLTRGSIAVALDAVHQALGRSERDFSRNDPRIVSIITETLADVLKVRITGPAHAFNLAKKHIAEDRTVFSKKPCERALTAACLTRLAEKLTNGHAGTWL